MKDLKFCIYHEDVVATNKILLEGNVTVEVCEPCKDAILRKDHVQNVCKYCRVPVVSVEHPHPARGRNKHKPDCPRFVAGVAPVVVY